MSSSHALGLLRTRAQPFFSTRDAAATLGLSLSWTSGLLAGLAAAGLVRRVRQGHWALDPAATPLAYAGWVTAPMPSYASLYTALFHHGLIQQIPRVTYAVSLAKTRVLDTALGEYSVHQIAPELFGGFVDQNGIRLATAEKAVFDTLYLARARSGKFAGLTEVDLGPEFNVDALNAFVDRISNPASRRRTATAVAKLHIGD